MKIIETIKRIFKPLPVETETRKVIGLCGACQEKIYEGEKLIPTMWAGAVCLPCAEMNREAARKAF
jgi:hypothetical protein